MKDQGGASLRDYVEAWIAGRVPLPPIVQLLGIRLLTFGNGEGTAEVVVGPHLHNAMGSLHGGVLCDFADVTIGAAVASTLGPGEGFVTLSLAIDFLRGTQSGLLKAHARIVKRGSRVAFCACRIEDEHGAHVAELRSSCLIQRSE
jgi:uncharacterized protein (TIGR00369 family)